MRLSKVNIETKDLSTLAKNEKFISFSNSPFSEKYNSSLHSPNKEI